MAGVPKTIRLRKVASEFNLGISTVVDFLSQKGFELESNPNAKISDEMYVALQEEFQTEKTAREELRLFGADAVEHETISLDDTVKKPTRKKQEQDEVLIKNIENVSGIEDIVEPEPKKKDITIVGKIDIEKKEKPPKPAKKDKKEEVKKTEAEEEKKEKEVIRAKIEKLDGPKVIRKIDLPKKEEKKKPVASSAEEKDADKPRKKRRKRIKQEPVDKFKEGGERKSRHRKGRKEPKPELTEEEIQSQIKDTLAKLSGTGKSKASKYRRAKREAVSEQKEEDLKRLEEEKTVLKVTEFVTANELATMMEVSANEIISACMSLGLLVSINQRLDAETISIVAEEFGFKVEFISAELQEAITVKEDDPDKLHERPPIVTVMGHVDHGKTLLLDYIRKANVIAGEAGGITQHIGAYSVELDDEKRITFLDTPGHEAFTAMRARGAQITDIAIIVIAADDSIMPQTKEAINHAQAANVPMIFAINKIDKPGADPEKIKEQLSAMNILVEDWGGKFQSQDISAKQGTNIDELLEKVLLEAEMLELKAVSEKNALGTIIESELDKGRGYVTTILVESGTLKAGDIILAGCYYGRVKAMHNERGKEIKEALPSVPVTVLGLNGAPNAGDKFNVIDDEREARIIATKRLQLQREQGVRTQKHITLDEIGRRIAVGDFQELNVIIKGDVDGSVEALADALVKLTTDTIQVNVILKSVGQISESDVMLATASDAVIVGFQVRPSANARKLAETEQIDIRLYSVIYDAIEEVKAAMEGMLAPTIEERIVCNIEIREVYKITKVGTIAGCYVQDGKVTRKTKVRLLREGIVVYTGALGSLKRFKDDVKEVKVGYECGLNIENFNDIKVGDMIEGFEEVEIKSTL